jgi:hypothetical protein
MHHDREHEAAAIRHANARIAALQEQVAREMADVSARGSLTAEHGRLDRLWILYGIKQVSIDPQGCLRLKRQADELETVHTARLYAAIQEGFDWAVSELLEIAEELFEDDGWRAFSEAKVASVQARTPEIAGMIERERLFWAFAQAYVCGMFASAYPDDLLRYFPTMARIDADVRGHDGEEIRASVVAMQLALIDLLMPPNEAGWHELVDRN